MNDEQSGPGWLTGGAGSPDLDGATDQGPGPVGYRGALADDAPAGGASAHPEPGRQQADAGTADAGAAEGGAAEAEAAAAEAAKAKKVNRAAWRELPILIVVALAIALVIKTFVV